MKPVNLFLFLFACQTMCAQLQVDKHNYFPPYGKQYLIQGALDSVLFLSWMHHAPLKIIKQSSPLMWEGDHLDWDFSSLILYTKPGDTALTYVFDNASEAQCDTACYGCKYYPNHVIDDADVVLKINPHKSDVYPLFGDNNFYMEEYYRFDSGGSHINRVGHGYNILGYRHTQTGLDTINTVFTQETPREGDDYFKYFMKWLPYKLGMTHYDIMDTVRNLLHEPLPRLDLQRQVYVCNGHGSMRLPYGKINEVIKTAEVVYRYYTYFHPNGDVTHDTAQTYGIIRFYAPQIAYGIPLIEFNFKEYAKYKFNARMIDGVSIAHEIKTQTVQNENIEVAQLTLYPNPTKHLINWKYTGASPTIRIEVLDSRGALIQVVDMQHQTEGNLSTASWPQGMYTFRLLSEDKTLVRRLAVVR
jgi:hypothetical protein